MPKPMTGHTQDHIKGMQYYTVDRNFHFGSLFDVGFHHGAFPKYPGQEKHAMTDLRKKAKNRNAVVANAKGKRNKPQNFEQNRKPLQGKTRWLGPGGSGY